MNRTSPPFVVLLLLGLGLTAAEPPSCGIIAPDRRGADSQGIWAKCEALDEQACLADKSCAPEYALTQSDCTCPPCADTGFPCLPCKCPPVMTFVACHDQQSAPCTSLGEAACLARADCQPVYGAPRPPSPIDAGASIVSRSRPRTDAGPDPVPPARDGGPANPVADAGTVSVFQYCDKRPACPPVCDLYCKNGHVKDAHGCELCECNPTCPAPVPCPFCPNGYAVDERGCQICECKPSCPDVACMLYCENGFQKDANGCDLCACNPPCSSDDQCPEGQICQRPAIECLVAPCPVLPGTCVPRPQNCTSNEECAEGEVCSMPIPSCPPGAACAMALGTCRQLCSSKVACPRGLTCQEDPNDPCNSGKVECLLPGRSVCLPAPAPSDCTADAQCPAGKICTVNCLPGMACVAVIGQCVDGCRSDANCPAGETCQPDLSDPCNSDPNVRCFAPGHRSCLPGA